MLENSVYSILSPEGFASILWKDSKLAKEAAGVMKLTAQDLKNAGIVEQVITEPEEFTVGNLSEVIEQLKLQLMNFFKKQESLSTEEIVNRRYERFRNM